MDIQRSGGDVTLVAMMVWTWCLLAGFSGVVGKKDYVPYNFLFDSEVEFQNQVSNAFYGEDDSWKYSWNRENHFQFLQVTWLRQTQGADNRTLIAGFRATDDDREPRVAWLINGRLVHEADRTFRQSVTPGVTRMASITIPDVISVTSLQLLLILDTFEALTDINLQALDAGHSIAEQGTDVALALSPQENVTLSRGRDDVTFLARFFSEELTDAVSDSLEVRYLRILPTNPDVTLQIVTPQSHPDVMSAWEPASGEVHESVGKFLDSDFRRHALVKIEEDSQNIRGLVEFTASYRTDSSCRLFGGQKIKRRAFVRSENDRGGYWGRGGPMVFLPFQRNIQVSCGANVDVSVTAIGESPPSVYLVKDGEIQENGNDVTIFLFQRLLQTEAVFRFENVSPEVSGRYVVWAENGEGRTDETSFTLLLKDDDC